MLLFIGWCFIGWGFTGWCLGLIYVADSLTSGPKLNEPPHDKTNKMAYAPCEDSDQPGHRPVWWVFAVCSVGSWGPNFSSHGQRRLWSDWADAQTDPSLCWAHKPFCWFYHEAAQMQMGKENIDRTSVKLMSHLRKMTKLTKWQKLTAGLNPNHMHIFKPWTKRCAKLIKDRHEVV